MNTPLERFSAVVVASPASDPGGERTETIRALGGRIAALVAPADAVALLDDHAGAPIVVLDVRGEANCAALLARIDTLAAERAWPLVVALDPDQIDLVAATCISAEPQLLCDPSAADWIAALVAARASYEAERVSDLVSESEAARLTRLNAEVARIAEVLSRLSRRDEPAEVRRANERVQSFGTRPPEFDVAALEVRDVIRARRLRDRFWGSGLFEDPAWDMLLDLFAAHLEHGQVSVSSLCIAAAVAPTTALRWIAKLVAAGLLEREPDPFDKRRAFMRLSGTALDGMRRYIAALREAGLPLL